MASLPSRLLRSRRARVWAAVAAVVLVLAWWRLAPYLRGARVRLDAARPWLLEFGRGSGWHGLDTVKVLEDGTVILHRQQDRRWETARLTLPAPALTRLREAVDANGLLDLNQAYHGGVADGTQWVLRIRQGELQKAVYCDNRFPGPVVRFAAALDEVLAAHGLGPAAWRGVAYVNGRAHERELWDSIRR